jgi:hypothetical protein
MEHKVKLIKGHGTRYTKGCLTSFGGVIRLITIEVDGVLIEGSIFLSATQRKETDILPIKYTVKLDNKEIYKHKDWKLIRRKILECARKRYPSMARTAF